jgi:uncharacterized protein
MAKKSSKKSGKGIVLLILCTIAFGLWWLLQNQTVPGGMETSGHKYKLQKTGAGVVVDFIDAARAVDAAVLKTVKDSGFKSTIGDRVVREVPRTHIEGAIKWENRRLTLAIPPGARTTDFEEALSQAVQKTGGQIFNTKSDTVDGKSAIRMNIGLVDTLEGDGVTVTTHTIWLVSSAGAPVPPPVKRDNEEEITLPTKNKVPEPKETPSKKKAEPVLPNERGRLALVIDDFGLTMAGVDDFLNMQRPLTLSILPYHPYSAEIARQAVARGKQAMLHLPTEPLGGERMEPTTILTTMTDEQIKTRAQEAIAAVPDIIGVNNHQGSKATADARVMQAALSVIREKGLFFVDSRTNTNSVAFKTAQSLHIKTAENDLFIDNSNDLEAIKRQLRIAGNLAVRQGEAIAIGHIRPNTAAAIKAMIPELESMGVRLVFVSQLVQ